jgi:hypothetical protein
VPDFLLSALTLFAYDGTYANIIDVPFETILPFAFPFGLGGPKMNQRVKVSLQLCIQLYMQSSLQPFMEGPTILVMNLIYNTQMAYMSGMMMCRSAGLTMNKYTIFGELITVVSNLVTMLYLLSYSSSSGFTFQISILSGLFPH